LFITSHIDIVAIPAKHQVHLIPPLEEFILIRILFFKQTGQKKNFRRNCLILNFNNAFSITAWVNEKTTGATRAILNKSDASSNKGYALFIDSGVPKLRIYDSDSYTDYDVDSYTLTAGTAYHIAATYDLDNDEVIFYVYKKAVGGVATTTLNSLKTLVNYSGTLNWSLPNYFDGVIDDVRVYNRVLSAEEIWALQSQGAS